MCSCYILCSETLNYPFPNAEGSISTELMVSQSWCETALEVKAAWFVSYIMTHHCKMRELGKNAHTMELQAPQLSLIFKADSHEKGFLSPALRFHFSCSEERISPSMSSMLEGPQELTAECLILSLPYVFCIKSIFSSFYMFGNRDRNHGVLENHISHLFIFWGMISCLHLCKIFFFF